MALFGAPVAHEDAPHRAIRAALAIRSVLEEFNQQRLATRNVELQARIGVHTGPVVVGTVGNDFKMDYTATGDTTNLASRLESLAPPGRYW
jgi:class 3 adenylate cyclase